MNALIIACAGLLIACIAIIAKAQLRAVRENDYGDTPTKLRASLIVSSVIILAFAGATTALYSHIGNPGLPAFPSNMRSDVFTSTRQYLPRVQDLVARHETLQTNSTSIANDWSDLALQFAQIGDLVRASSVQQQGIARFPASIELLLNKARIIRLQKLEETPDTMTIMREVLVLDAQNSEAKWFLGLGILQQEDGDIAQAKALIGEVIAALPAKSPHRQALLEYLREALPPPK